MTSVPTTMILIAGGVRDPNVLSLIDAARAGGLAVVPLLIGEDETPSLTWELDSDELFINGELLSITGAFLRRDVFHGGGPDADYRATTWYGTLQGWLAASPRIRILNRTYIDRHTNKLHALRLARDAGLTIPRTIATNELALIADSHPTEEMIAKPVPGGGYCALVDELLEETELRDGIAAGPAIVQTRLSGPDLRIYRVNGRSIGFRIESDALDYRTTRTRNITPVDSLPEDIIRGLDSLMQTMGMDWGAADFKLDPASGEMTFLEINSNPMFSVFDRVADGAISREMLDALSNLGY